MNESLSRERCRGVRDHHSQARIAGDQVKRRVEMGRTQRYPRDLRVCSQDPARSQILIWVEQREFELGKIRTDFERDACVEAVIRIGATCRIAILPVTPLLLAPRLV